MDLDRRHQRERQESEADQEEHREGQASAEIVVAGDSHTEEADHTRYEGSKRPE